MKFCFPNHTHIVFYDACVGLVQWSISNREDSHPMKLNSTSQKWRAFPQTSAERFTFLPAFESNVPFLNAIARILFVVELRKAETTSTSTNIRTTRSESFALFVSSDSFLNAFLRILILMRNHFLCDF